MATNAQSGLFWELPETSGTTATDSSSSGAGGSGFGAKPGGSGGDYKYPRTATVRNPVSGSGTAPTFHMAAYSSRPPPPHTQSSPPPEMLRARTGGAVTVESPVAAFGHERAVPHKSFMRQVFTFDIAAIKKSAQREYRSKVCARWAFGLPFCGLL